MRERCIEAAGQFLVAERLAQKADGPSIKHVVANSLVWEGRDKDYRCLSAFRNQTLQELDAAKALHVNVENEATRLVRVRVQEIPQLRKTCAPSSQAT